MSIGFSIRCVSSMFRTQVTQRVSITQNVLHEMLDFKRILQQPILIMKNTQTRVE